jgi:tetratricopeptide (TPR) repeat protein
MTKTIILFLSLLLFQNSVYAQDADKKKRNSRVAYNTAVESIKTANYELALSYLDAALELDPGFTDALLQRGKVKVELRLISKALEDFSLASQLNDKNGEPFFYLGYLQFNGDTGKIIIDNINQAIQKGYKTPQAYYNRGLYKLLTRNFSSAIEDFTAATGLQENFATAYNDRALAKYGLGDRQGALQDLKQATNYNHDFPIAFVNMGLVKAELGDYSGAIEDYSIAINLDPKLFVAYNSRGCAKYLLGNINSALEDFNQAISLTDRHNAASINKACCLAKNGGYNDALTILNEVIASNDKFPGAYLNRGLTKELLGDIEGACSDWKKALEMGIIKAQDYIKECK